MIAETRPDFFGTFGVERPNTVLVPHFPSDFLASPSSGETHGWLDDAGLLSRIESWFELIWQNRKRLLRELLHEVGNYPLLVLLKTSLGWFGQESRVLDLYLSLRFFVSYEIERIVELDIGSQLFGTSPPSAAVERSLWFVLVLSGIRLRILDTLLRLGD